METYVALFRGPALERAKTVAVAVDPEIVELVASQLLARERGKPPEGDSVRDAIRRGRRSALRAVIQEARRFRSALGAEVAP